MTYRKPGVTCPACGYASDSATYLTPKHSDDPVPPADDDLSICLACASVNVFTFNGSALRLPTADERSEFARNAEIQRAVQILITTRDRSSSWPKGAHQR